jgi:uncharacterized protein (DUF58 family)
VNRHRLVWRPTAHARRLITLSSLAVLLGLALGRPEVAALAAVPLAFVFVSPGGRPSSCEVRVSVATRTCLENELVPVTIEMVPDAPVELARVDISPGGYVRCLPEKPIVAADVASAAAEVRFDAARWGRRRIGSATAELIAGGALWRATVPVELGELAVYPQPTAIRRLPVSPLRGGLAGEHGSRRAGAGGEFYGIRPYGPGDSPARVNWPTSLRLQRLHVTQRRAEEAVDVVVVIDTLADVGPPGASNLDLSVRGACGLAHVLLRTQDRVGVVALGGWLRWLQPGSGERQFYRIVATMMDVLGRESYVDPDVGRIPAKSVPSGAQIVVFSPLLDPRALTAIEQLRGRGLQVTVVDVLTAEPTPSTNIDRLALRLWRLEREAAEHALAGLGVPVVAWDGRAGLDLRLAPFLSGRRRGAIR